MFGKNVGFYGKGLLSKGLFPTITLCLSCTLHAQTINYTYDALGRLTFATDSVNGYRDYDYDAAGNRIKVNIGLPSDDATAAPAIPAVPAGLQQQLLSGYYKANWGSVSGATSYQYKTKQLPDVLSTTQTNSTTINQPDWVRACNSAGCSATASFVY